MQPGAAQFPRRAKHGQCRSQYQRQPVLYRAEQSGPTQDIDALAVQVACYELLNDAKRRVQMMQEALEDAPKIQAYIDEVNTKLNDYQSQGLPEDVKEYATEIAKNTPR